eukprot:3580743-Karenia_brevis.AAC.1
MQGRGVTPTRPGRVRGVKDPPFEDASRLRLTNSQTHLRQRTTFRNLREFVTYRHPNLQRVWKGGSRLLSLPPLPLQMILNAQIGRRILKSLVFVTPSIPHFFPQTPPSLSSQTLVLASLGAPG